MRTATSSLEPCRRSRSATPFRSGGNARLQLRNPRADRHEHSSGGRCSVAPDHARLHLDENKTFELDARQPSLSTSGHSLLHSSPLPAVGP